MEKRGQGALEYLLIIGAAILVIAIVILAVMSTLNAGSTQVRPDQVFEPFVQFAVQGKVSDSAKLTVTVGGPSQNLPDVYTGGSLPLNPTELVKAYNDGYILIDMCGEDAKEKGYTASTNYEDSSNFFFGSHTEGTPKLINHLIIKSLLPGETCQDFTLYYSSEKRGTGYS